MWCFISRWIWHTGIFVYFWSIVTRYFETTWFALLWINRTIQEWHRNRKDESYNGRLLKRQSILSSVIFGVWKRSYPLSCCSRPLAADSTPCIMLMRWVYHTQLYRLPMVRVTCFLPQYTWDYVEQWGNADKNFHPISPDSFIAPSSIRHRSSHPTLYSY